MKLLNWHLTLEDDDDISYVLAWGIIKKKKGIFYKKIHVRTSRIVKIKKLEDKFVICTFSRNKYKLDFDKINKEKEDETKKALNFLIK